MTEVLTKVFLIVAAFLVGLCLGPTIAQIEKEEKLSKYLEELEKQKEEEK